MLNFITIPIMLFLLCILLGISTKRIFHFRKEKNVLIVGFVVFFASFFLISTPFMLFEIKLSYMIYILGFFYGIIIGVGLVLACKYLKKNKVNIKEKCKVFYMNKYQFILFIAFITMVAYQIGYVVFFQHADIDDSYYLAQTNTYSFTDYIGKVEPSSGLTFLTASKQYALVSFEIIYAVINRIFGVNTAYLAHTIWPVFAIICHYVVVYALAKRIKEAMKWEFCILYSVINLFSGFTAYTDGAFLLNRIWQGKTVFVAIFIPIMILEFIDIYEKINFREIIYLWMILLAGISTTTVAIYLFPILYFCLWLGEGIAKKNIKSLIGLCIPIVGIIPWVIIKLKMMYIAGNSGASVQQSVTGGVDNLSYSQQLFSRFLNGHSIIIVGYIIALVIIGIIADKKIRSVIVYPSIVLFITFANPVFIKYVAQWVTGVDVYWRIFWLFNISMTFIIGTILIMEKCKNEREAVIGLLVSLAIILACGTSVFENGGWNVRSNRYKLDSSVIQIADAIHKDSKEHTKILLMPKDMAYGIREYCGDICTIVNRYSYESFRDSGLKEEYDVLQKEIYNALYKDQIWDSDKLKNQINEFDIDYVVIYTGSIQNNQILDEFTAIYKNDQYILYRCY